MKTHLIIVIILAAFICSVSAFAADGSKVYKEKCSLCHGPAGGGTPMGPSFKGNEFITKGKAADIKIVILEGRSGSNKKYAKISMDMPKISMSDEDVQALISYMQVDLQK
ncbi:MAG: cytochrome c [Nitrospirae bacterium]|nr:cytochrome c [Nitrospirota bacterium]